MSKIFLTDIEIEGLFGYYNYKFSELADDPDFNNFITIHGNNGSGKTNLLKLISAILSSRSFDGSKSYLMNVRFTKIIISLSSGIKIVVHRETELGSYTINLVDLKGVEFTSHYYQSEVDELNPEKFNAIRESDDEYFEFISIIENIGIRPVLITHERQIIESYGKKSSEDLILEDTIVELIDKDFKPAYNKFAQLKTDKYLAETWIQNQVRKSSDLGIMNTNKLYLDLLRMLKSDSTISPENLKTEIRSVIEKASEVIEIGLMPDIEIRSFIDEFMELDLESASFEKVSKTVYYYFRTISEKIEALAPITKILKTFIEVVNIFLEDKKIHFDISKGFYLKLNHGGNIKIDELSSGEIQILILLFTAFKSNIDNGANLIIIDEPEISLNTTWQRKLLFAFKKISETSQTQFILATHSTEMIYEQYDQVVNLSKK